ncbi:MAG: multicopper oxidase domain-containing protein [Acidobacteriaceae bacterium]
MGVGREQSESIRGVAQTSAAPESIESAGRDRVLITRRNFLKHSSLTLASLAVSNPKSEASDAATLDPGSLKPFVDPLPIPTVAQPAGVRPNPEDLKQSVPVYDMAIRETRVKVHRDLPPTRMWTIGGSFPGVTIETKSGHAVQVNWKNQLPAQHFLPIDYTLHGAERNLPQVRSVIHLHGGRTPAASDGYPEEWIVPGKTQTCFYPLQQEAALLFYHDHTMGMNRLNIYAGMQGSFIVRDDVEQQLHLPKGKYEIPLMFCDRLLRTDGQLFYPVSENPKSPWVPEVFGNAILVNGKLLPYLDVEPRKYRFRLMNGSNGRFYRFSLQNQAEFHMIASDQGLLAAPVALTRLQLAPAERGDIIIDFSRMKDETVELRSDSFSILQFRVGREPVSDDSQLPSSIRPVRRLAESDSVRTRPLTLDERMDMVQRSMGMLLNNTPWHMPITEKPLLDTTEIWELINLTEDSHPIHLHLVRFQILDRRPFDTFEYMQKQIVRYTGPVVPPSPAEMGWKDTARADPGMVTRIIVPFQGYAGRYVWHCHILEHEDNEMMRPYEVLPATTTHT